MKAYDTFRHAAVTNARALTPGQSHESKLLTSLVLIPIAPEAQW